jgi:hypothetical protein
MEGLRGRRAGGASGVAPRPRPAAHGLWPWAGLGGRPPPPSRAARCAAVPPLAPHRGRQGRLSEVELRLWLAGQGLSGSETDKVVRLVRSLVRADRLDLVTL